MARRSNNVKCPFCGTKNKVLWKKRPEGLNWTNLPSLEFRKICRKCGFHFPFKMYWNKKEKYYMAERPNIKEVKE